VDCQDDWVPEPLDAKGAEGLMQLSKSVLQDRPAVVVPEPILNMFILDIYDAIPKNNLSLQFDKCGILLLGSHKGVQLLLAFGRALG
jgi:hypothetical protein